MASAQHPTGTSRLVDPNTPARLAFWLALISIPLGPVFGIPAIVAGVMGLRRQAKAPSPHGTRNAWIGIAVGLLSTAAWLWVVWSLAIGAAGSQD